MEETASSVVNNNNRMDDELKYPILLAERVLVAVNESDSCKTECFNVARLVDKIAEILRALARFISTAQSLYDRPIRRIIADVSKNLEKALTLVRKCKRRSVIKRVMTIITGADFRKLSSLLEASIGDLKWLASVVDTNNGGGIVLTLPPIANNDPILAWVWSSISAIHLGILSERIEAANQLASLAQDNDRNKQMITEEDGVPPLLKLLKESGSHEAQIASATALYHLANDRERVRSIVSGLGIPIVVNVIADSPMRVQICVARLVARMAEHDPLAQEDFARENAIRPLVTLLSFEMFPDDQNMMHLGKQSIHSIVQINKEIERNSLKSNYRPYMNSFTSFHKEGGSSKGGQRKERENESPDVKLSLKISCAEALWMLARGSVSNSKRITETKGLLCLAKVVEKEEGELQYNCLMTIKEITAAAESNADLRRAAFKTNSPAAKAVVDQLLRVIQESSNPRLQIPAMRSIGSLSRTFSAKETRVIGPLVTMLGNISQEVATEAAIALGKFCSTENFLHEEHSKTIIEYNGVQPLMRLLRGKEKTQLHALVVLCYLVLHAGNKDGLEQARVLTALEGVDRTLVAQRPDLRDLVSKAIYHINLYHTGPHSQRLSFVP